jgi:hypothetical protein
MCDIDELDDFEVSEATYSIWAIGYTKEDTSSDIEIFLGDYEDPNTAVAKAKDIELADISVVCVVPSYVSYFRVEVDTKVGIADDYIYSGVIYYKTIDNIAPAADIQIEQSEYELTDIGNLRIFSEKALLFAEGSFINVLIGDREKTLPILLKVLINNNNYIECEFID